MSNLLQRGLWQWAALQVDSLEVWPMLSGGKGEGHGGAQRAPLQLLHLMLIQVVHRVPVCTTRTIQLCILECATSAQMRDTCKCCNTGRFNQATLS